MHTPSYRTILPAEVAGWDIEEPLPPELVPVEIFQRDTEKRAWAQVADTRAQTLVASVLSSGDQQRLGVVLTQRPRLARNERGKPVENYPTGMQVEAVPSVELPTMADVETAGSALGEFYANPAHSMSPTSVRLDHTSSPRQGLTYIGLQELRDILGRGGIDARLLTAMLMVRAKQQIIFTNESSAAGQDFAQRVAQMPVQPARVVKQHTLQSRLGITHVTAAWMANGADREQLIRIENGTAVAAPGMALPHYRRADDVLQMGVVENWRPLVGTNGLWLTEIPGGFDGWKKELKGEFGVEADAGQASLMPTIVADPSAEGYDIDLRSVGLSVSGQQELDATEGDMMGVPSWLSDRRLMHCTAHNIIADGRTMAAMQMFELLHGEDFLAKYQEWQLQHAEDVKRWRSTEK